MEGTQGNPTSAASIPPASPPSGPPLSPTQALAAGWQAFLANPWPSLGVLLALLAIQVVGNLIPFINLLFGILVTPALYAGGAWFFLRGLRGEKPGFEDAFEGFQRWPSVTGALLIVFGVGILILMPMLLALIASIGVASLLSAGSGHLPDFASAALVPFFALMAITLPVHAWWVARTYVVFFVVMEADRRSAVDAVKHAFALTKGSVWRLVGLYVLWIGVTLLGCLALCVGIFPAMVVCYYSFAHAYEQLRARAA
jgi:uncharacterized membrane protein